MTCSDVRHVFLIIILLCTALNSRSQTFSADTVSDEVFARMQGYSFPQGCTVAREDLRYLRISHYDGKGQERVGEMVCNKCIADDLLDIFEKLYQARYPIERMELIDNYEADDERSMSANNTSCFCFRAVAGSAKLSKHAMGLAVDVNPLYNPYVKMRKDGTLFVQPKAGSNYLDRKKRFPYMIVKGDLLYQLFIAHGFTWGGSWRSLKDYQHFEK